MVENIFATLENIGFTHPLHPMFVHAPMGLIIGAVVFSFLGLKWKNHLPQTAYSCAVLAFITIFPTIVAGFLDWQHRLEGQWENLIIIKMVLSGILTLLLLFAIIAKRRGTTPFRIFLIYLLCLACAGGLGFTGGELVYG
jgi:uncharacterized membrane protein